MKKTLERLKENTLRDIEAFMKYTEMGGNQTNNVGRLIIIQAYKTINALVQYVRALEDYGGELDEEWDKLLKNLEQMTQRKKNSEDKTPRV